MDKKIAFSVLGIEETREEELIKAAYRQKLVMVNPEDDPEGFRRLRESYEAACTYAAQEEQVLAPKEDTPVSRWIDQVEAIYRLLPERLLLANWKQLLQDEVCLSLETNMEARNALFRYLSEHFRLSPEIWRLLDEHFFIEREADEFKELFPEGFVDYMLYQCKRTDNFPYELFEGEPDADYDTYIYQLFELIPLLDTEKKEEARPILQTLEELDIYHPWTELEQARYNLLDHQPAAAIETTKGLLAKYEDLRIRTFGEEILWKGGRHEEAIEVAEKILEEYPDQILSNRYMAAWCLEQKNYEKARKHCIAVLQEAGNDSDMQNMLRQINEGLIPILQDRCKSGNEGIKPYLELGWCYLQNETPDKGVDVLSQQTPDTANEAEYNSLLGRLYYNMRDYENSVHYSAAWRAAIERETPQDEKEQEKIPARLAATWELAAKAQMSLAQNGTGSFADALESVRAAIQLTPENLMYKSMQAELLNLAERYKEAADICLEILEQQKDYFWAIVYAQEAYYKLGRHQEVIDFFYRAKPVFAGFPPVYERTVRVFSFHSQWKDMQSILQQADENQVTSDELEVCRALAARKEGEENGDYQPAYEICKEIVSKLKNKNCDPTLLAEAYGELAICCRRTGRLDEGLEIINRAIKIQPISNYLWAKANILIDNKKPTDALPILAQCEKETGPMERIDWCIAQCHLQLADRMKALVYFEKIRTENPENPDVNGEIVEIYTHFLKSSEDIAYFEKGLPYANRQVELSQRTYSYMTRGLLYLAARETEKAVADFEELLKENPDDPYAHNNIGYTYKCDRQYEKAVEAFKKAIKDDSTRNPRAHINLAECYREMKQYEDAIALYHSYAEIFPEQRFVWEDLSDTYEEMGDYAQAYQILKEHYPDSKPDRISIRKAELLWIMGKPKQAISICKKMIAADVLPYRAYCMLGDIAFYEKDQMKKAVKYFEKAKSHTKRGSHSERRACRSLMRVFYTMGDDAQAHAYFDCMMESIKDAYGSIELYENAVSSRPQHLFWLGSAYYYIKDFEKAEEYYRAIGESKMCPGCTYAFCTDGIEAMGLLCETRGEYQEAMKYYRRVLEESKMDHACIWRLRILAKK